MFRVFAEFQRQLGKCLQPLLETSGKGHLHPYGFRNCIPNSLTTADASLSLLGADIAEWMRGTASPIAFVRLAFKVTGCICNPVFNYNNLQIILDKE